MNVGIHERRYHVDFSDRSRFASVCGGGTYVIDVQHSFNILRVNGEMNGRLTLHLADAVGHASHR